MDIRHLKTLIALAEHKSYVAAADAIGLSQSAESLHIKALEQFLKTRLFDRSSRPALMNVNGHALVEKARALPDKPRGAGCLLSLASLKRLENREGSCVFPPNR